MTKLTDALLSFVFVVSLSQTGHATNYREYKKFNLSDPTERVPSKCHAHLKERRNYYYCDKWWEFLHHD
jgi:hypothetical protein